MMVGFRLLLLVSKSIEGWWRLDADGVGGCGVSKRKGGGRAGASGVVGCNGTFMFIAMSVCH